MINLYIDKIYLNRVSTMEQNTPGADGHQETVHASESPNVGHGKDEKFSRIVYIKSENYLCK